MLTNTHQMYCWWRRSSTIPPRIISSSSSFQLCPVLVAPISTTPLSQWPHIPTTPKYLGLAGLAPFVFTTLGAYTCSVSDILSFQTLQLTYGASILSFLGAVHWGSTMADNTKPGLHESKTTTTKYICSVLPSLIGFVSLNIGQDVALILQNTGFLAVLYMDKHFINQPKWYLTLRYWLTAIVVSSLSATWYAGRFRHRPAFGGKSTTSTLLKT